jgi:hypothetical protein
MSTRANIIIKDEFNEKIIFYRHSDGYPEGTMPTLEKFLNMVINGEIRNNSQQASGWLVLIGHDEYKDSINEFNSWKVGAYEPTSYISDDAEYIYTVDLKDKKISYCPACDYKEAQ